MRPPQRHAGANGERERRTKLEEACVEHHRFVVGQRKDEADVALGAEALDLLVEPSHKLAGTIGLQDEKIDELDAGANLAVRAHGLADHRDLSDFPGAVGRGQHAGAAAKAPLIEPLDALGGKVDAALRKRLGRNARRQFIVNGRLFRNRDHLGRASPLWARQCGARQTEGNSKLPSTLMQRKIRLLTLVIRHAELSASAKAQANSGKIWTLSSPGPYSASEIGDQLAVTQGE